MVSASLILVAIDLIHHLGFVWNYPTLGFAAPVGLLLAGLFCGALY